MHTFHCVVTDDVCLREMPHLRPGTSYALDDINAAELLAREMGTVGPGPALPCADVPPGNRVVFVRPGGFGDLLFLTPLIADLRLRHPGIEIAVACLARFASVLEGVCETVRYPVPVNELARWSRVVWLEKSLEGNSELARTRHAVEVFARWSKLWTVDALPDPTLDYRVTDAEANAAAVRFPRSRTPRVGFQFRASAKSRTYPEPQRGLTITALVEAGFETMLFGAPGDFGRGARAPRNLVDLTVAQPPLSFRESAAVLATCDVVVAPDSALAHVAAALEVPCVALYGPYPWALRTAPYPTTRALTGHAPCAPCFHHERPWQPWPTRGLCAATARCEALANIEPKRVLAEVKRFLEDKCR